MGQKINPKGFRLVTNQKHYSNFYNNKFVYPAIIKEDYLIRNQIIKLFNECLILSSIQINRTQKLNCESEFVNIKINLLYPRKKQADNFIFAYFNNLIQNNENKDLLFSKYKFKYKRKKFLKSRLQNYTLFILKRYIKKIIHTLKIKNNKSYLVSISLIKNNFENSALISKYITGEIIKRIKVRRIIKVVLKRILSLGKLSNILGLKIQLSGRLNGIEMARKEWKRNGQLPLHCLKAIIDYSQESINTTYGTIGVKVWLYKKLV
eukprot:GDKK01042476.1.p2 GENE.GDKK01042476.1~~GDKK01042476.1.p2  ORF type:complete len:264 (-),score=-16.33 GDKK01042476.1:3191-3982(-)